MIIGSLQCDVLCYIAFICFAFLITASHSTLTLFIDYIRRYCSAICLYNVPFQRFSVIKWTVNAILTDKMPTKQGLGVNNLPITKHLFAKTNLIKVFSCLNISGMWLVRWFQVLLICLFYQIRGFSDKILVPKSVDFDIIFIFLFIIFIIHL